MIAGCILATGCVLKPTANATKVPVSSATTIPLTTVQPDTVNQAAVPVLGEIPEGITFGQLNVSIGEYNDLLPVYIDNMSAGQVSAEKMLSLKVGEGMHSVKVCSGSVCEVVETEIKSGIKTTIDFETRLKTDAPQGSLVISIGDYSANLPVLIDNTSAGTVTANKALEQIISMGNHTVKICNGDNCFSQNVTIRPGNQTSIDFGERLKNDITQGSLSVSIGGYNAENLPVRIDNLSVGNVSLGKPVTIRLKEGNHTVQVCVGMICEKEEVNIQFAKQSSVDFGDRLKADVEFPSPVVRIASSVLSGQDLTIEVEFINPDTVDHTMAATVSCVYSYMDSQNIRRNDAVQKRITTTVTAGSRDTQEAYLYLGGGTNVMVSDPVIVDVVVK